MKALLVFSGLSLSVAACATAASTQPSLAAASKAYVVIEITVTDPVQYEDYKAAIAPLITKYGGRYLARAGRTETVEGAPPDGRAVLLEFPSFDHAMAFEHAPDTLAASEIRHRSAKSRIYVVEGVTP